MFGRLFGGNKRKTAKTSGFSRFFGREITPWLRLLRVHRLFAIAGDPLAGACIAAVMARGELSFWTLLNVCFCSLSLAAFGMIQNDWCDLVSDRRGHPDRPLASRQIPVLAAAIVAIACFVVALALAVLSGHRVFLLAATLVILISAYNLSLKKTPVGAVVGMGLCRALNVMLGASLVGISPAVFVLMLVFGAYAALLMKFRGVNPRLREVPGWIVFVPALLLLAGWLVTLPWTASRGSFLAPFIFMAVSVAVASVLAYRIFGRAVGVGAIRRFAKLLFFGLIPYQAAWLAMPEQANWIVVLVCAAVFWLASFYLDKLLEED